MNHKLDPEQMQADIEIDARGLRCPEPLMVVRNCLMDMQSGETIKVVTTDPSTSWDIPNFCKFLNHELLQQDKQQHERGEEYYYWIRKG